MAPPPPLVPPLARPRSVTATAGSYVQRSETLPRFRVPPVKIDTLLNGPREPETQPDSQQVGDHTNDSPCTGSEATQEREAARHPCQFLSSQVRYILHGSKTARRAADREPRRPKADPAKAEQLVKDLESKLLVHHTQTRIRNGTYQPFRCANRLARTNRV